MLQAFLFYWGYFKFTAYENKVKLLRGSVADPTQE